jgi:multidrug efflux pump subunit AcrB
MNIAEFSIRQRVLVNLITFAAIIIGAFVTFGMQRDTFPDVEVDWVLVTAVYPGASPQEVEKLVTIPIEDALKNIDGIETYGSASRESASTLFVELEPGLANRDRVINEIAREVDKVDLPDDAEDPEVQELVIMHPLIEISFTGKGIGEERLRDHARNFEEFLKTVDGVGAVDRFGWRDREISIEVKPGDLEDYYMSLSQVIRSISNQNLNLPGGKIKSGNRELILRTVGELKEAGEFEDIIIRTNSDGQFLRLGDIASVKEQFKEAEMLYKTNGKPSVNLLPKKKKDGDTIRIVDSIKEEVKRYGDENRDEIDIALVNDMAFYVKRRLNVLTSNGSIGLVLLILTLLMFLNSRIALVTALGIPFAFLTALIFMSFFGVTLNLLTMFGLILVLGMIVDDAIVVSENVYRHMEEGMPVREAAVKGTMEVAAPVTATILTTAAAFAPLMFISGIMGKFLKFFPMGVIFCLAASLFEALVILPTHLADWVKPLKAKKDIDRESEEEKEKLKKERSFIRKMVLLPFVMAANAFRFLFSSERKGSEAGWFRAILDSYTGLLKFALSNRYKLAIGAFFILVAAVVFSVKVMPFKLFPDAIEMFYVRLETPEGTSLEATSDVLSEVEKILMTLPPEELENITSTVGFSGELGGGIADKYGTQYAQCIMYLTPAQNRPRPAHEIIADVRSKIEERNIPDIVNLEFEKVQGGPPVGKPVAVEVRGDEYPQLLKIRNRIIAFMKTVEGIEDIKDNYELDKEEIQISIDKREASRLGLSVRQIAMTIRYAFEGGVATTVRKGDDDMDVVVRLPEEARNSFETLKTLTIPNDMGRLIRLDRVAVFTTNQGIRVLNHQDSRRTVTITAAIDDSKITAVEANRKIKNEFADISSEYPGYFLKIGGEWEDTSESIQSIFKAFAVAFLLIYMILATQFKSFIQPLIIMTSVPYGLIGVVLALYFHGQPISMMALFGVVGLTGVVVNDSLILVDFINKRKNAGIGIFEAVMEAGRMRLRPIMLTSITTIIALMPLIYGIGGEEPFLVPAAIAMSYGLLAATFLTLVLVPCIYLIVNDISVKLSRKERGI